MFEKLEVMRRIVESGVIAVIRAESVDEALKIAEACKAGGIEALEITMTVPGALTAIEQLAKAYPNKEVLIGAGTVLDPETARLCILAGASFLVAPNLNEDTVKMAHRYGKVIMPGCSTITEIVHAMEIGADVVKYFPGNLGGPAAIKAFKGPLPHVPFCPTGGVSIENAGEWIKAGAVAIGVGGELTKGAKTGDFASITAIAREFVGKVRAARA